MNLAGRGLRRILARATGNKVTAILVGVLITSAMQSSSVTTVMVVSFSNAALLTLRESIGVIMGANIGTTTTAWIITLFGFEWSMQQLALPLVGFGFVFSLSKNTQVKNWGGFVVGFALLFIGLEYLKESLPNISDHPEMLEVVQSYTHMGYGSVLLFLLIGTILTLLLQSSSATMAVTLLMCHQGWIPFDLAAAMVLGENIGTTITANIAAFVANIHARRTALAHIWINVVGVLWMLVLFYPFLHLVDLIVSWVEGTDVVGATGTPLGLTVFHMSFNIANVFLLAGFIGLIERSVTRLIPEKQIPPAAPVTRFINENALAYPESAIQALREESRHILLGPVTELVAHALNMHRKFLFQEEGTREVIERSEEVIEVDVDNTYSAKIKELYSDIIAYGIQIHSELKLSEAQVQQLNAILTSDRKAVDAIKRSELMRNNLNLYMGGDNDAMHEQYNSIRRNIAKVLRRIHAIKNDGKTALQQLEDLGQQLQVQDLILGGELDELIISKEIDSRMASSLVNDNHLMKMICGDLIQAAFTLFKEDNDTEPLSS